MKIKNLYTLDDPTRNLIETTDGKLKTFISTPFREIKDSDLTNVVTPLPNYLYIRAAHAEPVLTRSLYAPYGFEFTE